MNLFWGVMLVLWGISLILKAVFNIHFPIVRVVFAIIIIWWGFRVLIGRSASIDKNTIIFSNDTVIEETGDSDYNIIFGSGKVDLREIDLSQGSRVVKVNVVFGEGRIILNPDLPTIVKLGVVFGEGVTPEGSVSFIGDRKYANSLYQKGENALMLEVNAIFGSARISN